MTDTARLKELIRESGYKLGFIAGKLDLSVYGFARKRDNISEFTQSEITALCELLHIDSPDDLCAIFFAK